MDFEAVPLPQENLGLVYDKVLDGFGTWMNILFVKRCTKCGQVKGREGFHPCKTNTDGRQGVCKECWRKNTRENKRRHRQEKKAIALGDPFVIAALEEKKRNKEAGLKVCNKCGEVKGLKDFYVCKGNRDGKKGTCKECFNQQVKEHNQIPEVRAWINAQAREHSQLPEVKAQKNKRLKERRANDPLFRFACCMRARIRGGLKGYNKSKRTEWYLDCTFEEAWAIDLIPKFRFPMTRENYGEVWEVDHIRPVCSFDLSDPEQVKACFHHSNLQPLFIGENRSKGGRY
jgi:hypothetical protein